jgi:diguanylate cyclase
LISRVAILDRLQGLRAWVFPRAPEEIRAALHQAQFNSVRKQVPMLLSVAALNTLIIMALCAHDNIPLRNYSWMSLLILYCAVRIYAWWRRSKRPVISADIPRLLRINIAVPLVMMTFLGCATTATFIAGTFKSMLIIPVSLGFGATSIAHCLYTLRPAAIGTLVIGIFPTSIAMMTFGNFDAAMLAVAMLSVAVLMIRFVSEQYDQLIASLFLEHQIRELANTDPLTGLANRRAIMSELDLALKAYETGAESFGVALLDLDGFKEINDQMGHHAGDIMLQKVAERLSSAVTQGDTVGRLGGDEFIVLMRGLTQANEISARTTAMLATLCQPVDIMGNRLSIAASLGYAQHPEDGANVEAILHEADTALYVAKRDGKENMSRRNIIPHAAAR